LEAGEQAEARVRQMPMSRIRLILSRDDTCTPFGPSRDPGERGTRDPGRARDSAQALSGETAWRTLAPHGLSAQS
jgi:hypothetical protein